MLLPSIHAKSAKDWFLQREWLKKDMSGREDLYFNTAGCAVFVAGGRV